MTLTHVPAGRASQGRKDRTKRLIVFKGARKMEDVALLDQVVKAHVWCFDVYL